MKKNILSNDLDYILKLTLRFWDELRHQHIFITGGTGFVGAWLLESFAWANEKLKLDAEVVVLTRHASRFYEKCPHLFNIPFIKFHEGDVRSFTFPKGKFSHIIHAAADTNPQSGKTDPQLVKDTIVQGTKHVFEFAKMCATKRLLFISSGAVYGKQPESAYATGKRLAENIACTYAKQYGIEAKIARCFAFVGPYLPLDTHYAIGNFIRDGLKGGPIIIEGDGTPYRSYLYSADLAIWLWTILFRGQNMRPYNVGSDEAFTINQIAHFVSDVFGSIPVIKKMQPLTNDRTPERYVPDIRQAREELQLRSRFTLNKAIESTSHWHLSKQGS